jgi:hypothetical protein
MVVRAQRRGSKPKASKFHKLPVMIEGMYTRVGAAAHLGIGLTTLETLLRQKKFRTQKHKNPGGHAPLTLLNAKDVEAYRAKQKRLGLNGVPAPTVTSEAVQ